MSVFYLNIYLDFYLNLKHPNLWWRYYSILFCYIYIYGIYFAAIIAFSFSYWLDLLSVIAVYFICKMYGAYEQTLQQSLLFTKANAMSNLKGSCHTEFKSRPWFLPYCIIDRREITWVTYFVRIYRGRALHNRVCTAITFLPSNVFTRDSGYAFYSSILSHFTRTLGKLEQWLFQVYDSFTAFDKAIAFVRMRDISWQLHTISRGISSFAFANCDVFSLCLDCITRHFHTSPDETSRVARFFSSK